MNRNLLCAIMLLHICVCSFAADNLRLGDIRSMGMRGNEVVRSALFNPALIAFEEGRRVGVDYFNRYGLKELGTMSGNFCLPNRFIPANIGFSSFGYDGYRESLFRLALAKPLSAKWALGISVQYAFLQTELFEEQPSKLSTDVGVTYSPVENVLIGLLIMNLPSVALKDKDIEVESFDAYLMQIGFQWKYIDGVLITATLGSNEEHPAIPAFGLEYEPFDNFSIRGGVGGMPFVPSFGVGYGFSRFTVDVAAVYHSVLGFSSGVGLQFSF